MMHYSQLWQSMIKQISRRDNQAEIYLDVSRHLFFEKQRVKICYQSSSLDSKVPETLKIVHHSLHTASQPVDLSQTDSHELLLQSDLILKNQHCGYFWPQQPGWYHIFSETESSTHSNKIYVEPGNLWLSHQQQNKIQATKAKQADFSESENNDGHYKKINQWIFWWMLLLSACMIWIERKLLSPI